MSHTHNGTVDARAAAAARLLHEQECAAMVAADVDTLGALLSDDFTLTHMTGYMQSRGEWLDEVKTGQMTYHAMENVDVKVEQGGDGVVLTARTVTEATIWAGHGTWRLELRTEVEETASGWMATRTVASTW